MGASTSTEQKGSIEQREAESVAASSGALPTLHNTFSTTLADPNSNAIPLESLKVTQNPNSQFQFLMTVFVILSI